MKLLTVVFLLRTSVLALETLDDVSCSKCQGTALPNGITQWLCVRYAAPPLGDLRFAPPQDPDRNETVQVADQYGKLCLATGDLPNVTTTSEDCLFLDVFTPSGATKQSKLPVYFYIQGGGFNANSNPNLNGSGLIIASGMNIVVVEINCRVGPYGFIAGSEIEFANNSLRDQPKALEWVQKYIHIFGGNPNHFVVGGDSAGAASVTLQLAAFGGRNDNLFHGTAAESQSFATVLTVNEPQYQYNNFVIRTGCVGASDNPFCLRSKTAAELQAVDFNTRYPGDQAPPLYMWNAVIDNNFINSLTYPAFASGNFVEVPLIFGDDNNGCTILTPRNTSSYAESDWFLQTQLPYLTIPQLATINSLYPKSAPLIPTPAPSTAKSATPTAKCATSARASTAAPPTATTPKKAETTGTMSKTPRTSPSASVSRIPSS